MPIVEATLTVAGTATMTAVYGPGSDVTPPASTASVATTMSAAGVLTDAMSSAAGVASGAVGQTLQDASASSTAALLGAFLTAFEMSATMPAALRMVAGLPMLAGRGEAWALTLEPNGTTRYEGFGFNSFVLYDGQYLGCKSDGLYVLTGEADDDEPVRASVSFGRQSMNTNLLKRMITAYSESSSTGKLLLKVTTAQGEFIYDARSFSEQLATHRFDLGRGLEDVFFTFELFNEDGCDFTLAAFEATAADVSHRRI